MSTATFLTQLNFNNYRMSTIQGSAAGDDHHRDDDNQYLLSYSDDDHDHLKRLPPPLTLLQQAYKSGADLVKYLPTGTAIAFRVLSPIVTDYGSCPVPVNRMMTLALLFFCALTSFVLPFTDSFTDSVTGSVRYGLATYRGLLIIDGCPSPPPALAAKYKLTPIDFVHAFMTLIVFVAVALADHNVVSCFYPIESDTMAQLVAAVPVVVGLLASASFVAFPTTRHGIGFPVTPEASTR
ncbi:protein DMP7-like [Zingiber officinale]|nr:protein DMP7-like [Zingiber officinale]